MHFLDLHFQDLTPRHRHLDIGFWVSFFKTRCQRPHQSEQRGLQGETFQPDRKRNALAATGNIGRFDDDLAVERIPMPARAHGRLPGRSIRGIVRTASASAVARANGFACSNRMTRAIQLDGIASSWVL